MIDFDYKEESLQALKSMNSDDRNELIDWCRNSFTKKLKTINYSTMTSYGLKHLYEEDELTNSSYVTNEQFRGAMIYLGFKCNNVMNMNFNISMKDEKNLERRIRHRVF